MSFGKRLKQARNNKKLLQSEVANRLGIDDTTISKYENDKSEPDNKTIKELATLYEVSVDWLVGRNKKENEYSPPQSKIDLIIKKVEDELGVSLKDDPLILENLENTIKMYAQLKKKSKES